MNVKEITQRAYDLFNNGEIETFLNETALPICLNWKLKGTMNLYQS